MYSFKVVDSLKPLSLQ